MRIEVTQEDIEKGEPCDVCACPIALAIQRKLGRGGCEINFSTIDLGPGQVVATPYSARQFIRAFDDHLPVKPFSFELDLSEPT